MSADASERFSSIQSEIYHHGYNKGREGAINEYVEILKKELDFDKKYGDLVVKLADRLKK